MNTTYKVYDKIRALAGDWEMYRNGIKWNTVFYMGDIVRGRIEKTNYESQYFTIESLENNNTVTFTKVSSAPANTFYYSLDDGATWTSSNATTSWTLQSGERVKLKATANAWSSNGSSDNSWYIRGTARHNVYGNIMSLLFGDNFENVTSLSSNNENAFNRLFYTDEKLVNSNNLILPATTLANNCYLYMFYMCTSMITAPELPATILANSCYRGMFTYCYALTTAPTLPATTLVDSCYLSMFYACTSLTTAPELPATTLAGSCYSDMFNGCSALTTAPELPATTLAATCYSGMFIGCTSLTTAPELPATTLAIFCYNYMFSGCSSLIAAPELSATTLADSCYRGMFNGCSNLNYIKCLATNISAYKCLENWVYGVAASGKFIKDASMLSWPTGESGIPSGWAVENAS